MANSEVIIDTKIDTSEVTKGANAINKKLNEVGQKTEQTAKRMTNAMKEALGVSVPTNEYAQFENELKTIARAMEMVSEKQKKFLADGGKPTDTEYKKLSNTLQLLQEKQNGVIAKMKEMTASSQSVSLDTGAKKEAVALTEEATAATGASVSMKALVGATGGLAIAAGAVVVGFKAVTKVLSILKNFAVRAFNVLKEGFKKVISYVTSLVNIGNIFERVASYTKEGLENLARFNKGVNPVNQNLSLLKSSLTQLKNSFATAFAPILSVVTPILNTLIQHLVDAVTALGMFFAKLTGATTFTKATQVNQKYADATKDAADAQKELNRELAGYDKLLVVSQKDANKSANSGASSAGSGIAFETVEIDNVVSDWADRFKEAWKNADFTDIGREISEKIANALDNINWTDIQAKCNQIAQSIGTFINGFVEGGAFQSLGTAIANALNTAIGTAKTFFDTVKWDELGTALGQSITNFLNTFSFTDLGLTLSTMANSILTMLTSAVRAISWESVGKGIVEMISAIDWVETWWNFTKLVNSLVMGIFKAIVGAQLTIWAKIKEALFPDDGSDGGGHALDGDFTELGENAVLGFIKGLVNKVVELGKKFKEIFVGSAEDELEIHSPSKKFITIGEYCVAGFVEGLKNKINDIINWFKEIPAKVKEKVGTIAVDIATKFADTKDTIKQKWNDLTSGISDKVAQISANVATTKDALKKAWNDVVGVVADKVASMKASVATKEEDIKASWNKVVSVVKDKTAKMKATVSTKKKDIENKFNEVLKGVKDKTIKVKVALQSIVTSAFKATWNTLANAINSAIITVNKLPGVNIMSRVPKLAKGAVIPPNKEFLAVLGDQKSGTNIEAPLDTIVEAMQIALGGSGGNNQPIQIVLDGKVVAQTVWDETEKKYKQTGYRTSFAY